MRMNFSIDLPVELHNFENHDAVQNKCGNDFQHYAGTMI